MYFVSFCQSTFTIIDPKPTLNDLTDIAFGKGMYVAVGARGTIISSVDGIEWSVQSSGISCTFNDVFFGNNTFVTVGDSGTVLTSADGSIWAKRNAGTTFALFSTTYGDNEYVCSGDSGKIIYSSDGITWASRPTGMTIPLRSITYGLSRYVIVTPSQIFCTSDWINWIKNSTEFYAYDVVYGNGLFIASEGRFSSTRPIYLAAVTYTSSDGIAWINSYHGGASHLTQISYNDNYFVAAGNYQAVSSTDGKIWNLNTSYSHMKESVSAIYNNNKIVAVGKKGTIVLISDLNSSTKKKNGSSKNTNSIIITEEIGFKTYITLSIPESLLNKSIFVTIYSTSGRLITRKTFVKIPIEIKIKIAGLSKGMYILNATTDNKTVSANFVMSD